MGRSSTEVTPSIDHHHLLGQPADLAGHLRQHGSLPVPESADRNWQQRFLELLAASGLAGRGGASFPSAVKLQVARAAGVRGTVVVNAMEGEPASDKDKVLLLRAPHLVLDGAQLLAAACGAERVVVCLPVGRDRVADAVALALAERAALRYTRVGEALARPPDRFVAGEESALAQWLDSGLSLPTFRPDKGVALRIAGRQALVYNTETLAHIGLIGRQGVAAFRAQGITEEPGTCLITITGSVMHPGVVEVPRGTPLRDIITSSVPSEPVDALLVGGYGGTWVGPPHFATPYASLSLRTIGATAGVGVIVVLGDHGCGIAESARIAHFLASQSSGQCGPCVFGLPAVADDLTLLAEGRPDAELMPRLLRRLDQIQGRGACRHPDGAVALVRSALGVFADDVAAHQAGRPCAYAHRPTVLRIPLMAGT